MDTRRIDLNLLLTFDRLMETRSVTGAAEALGMRQSSVSAALTRLRAITGDRLLERSGNRMVPTRGAELIWPEIRAALATIETSLQRLGAFDPAVEEAAFRIGMDEYTAMTLAPSLAASIRLSAPLSRIEVLPIPPPQAGEALAAGHIDVSVGACWTALPGLRVERLFDEDFVCLVDRRHPVAGSTLSLDSYLTLPHLLVSAVGRVEGNVDAALAARGLQRRVAVTVPYLLAAPQMLLGSEMILHLGRRLAERMADWYPVARLDPPIAIPGFSVAMAWHPRNAGSAAHRWLREQIAQAPAAPPQPE